jgi:Flp pilus assembly protein TadD
LILALGAIALIGGGWYVRAHYWLPKKHIESAETALDHRNFEEARRELDLYLETRPNDPRGHFLRAQAARRAGDLSAAEEHLARCEHLQNDKPDPEVGDTKLEWALLEVQRGKLLEMDSYLRRQLRKHGSDSVLILETMSWELMRRNRLQEALALLNGWLEIRPDEYEAHVRRGWVADHLLDFDQAIKDYRQALELQPDHDSVRLRIAELLVERNRASEAIEEIEGLRQLKPDDRDTALCFARALRLLNRTDEAKQVLDTLLAAHGSFVAAMGVRAQLAIEAGQTAEAEALLQKAAALEPLNRQINYTLLQCQKQLGKTQEAKETQARVAQADEQLKKMAEIVRKVMEQPYDPALRYEAGMIFLQNGMTREGLHWLSTALDAYPAHRPTHEALAQYYEKAGQKDRAAYHRQFLR